MLGKHRWRFDNTSTRYLLHRLNVSNSSVHHVTLPRPGRPSARLGVGVDSNLATIRAEIAIVSGVLCSGDRRSHADRQTKESFHVDHLRPGDLASVVSQTPQSTLVSGINVRVVADLGLLAEGAHVRVGLLCGKQRGFNTMKDSENSHRPEAARKRLLSLLLMAGSGDQVPTRHPLENREVKARSSFSRAEY